MTTEKEPALSGRQVRRMTFWLLVITITGAEVVAFSGARGWALAVFVAAWTVVTVVCSILAGMLTKGSMEADVAKMRTPQI